MRKVVGGIGMMFIGVILYVVMHQNAVNYMPQVTRWETAVGKFNTALHETGGMTATRIGIGFMVVGLLLFLYGAFEDTLRDKALIKTSKKDFRN